MTAHQQSLTFLTNLLSSFNLVMHVESATRITPHSTTFLDYICTNIVRDAIIFSNINAGLSDHEAILCKVSLELRKTKTMKWRSRLFTRNNCEKFLRICLGNKL